MVASLVVVVGGVAVIDVTALAAAHASSVGLNTFAFAFHFIFTFGGLVMVAVVAVPLPLARFLFLPFSGKDKESANFSQCLPCSIDAASTRSSIVACGGASIRRSPLLSMSSCTATAW